MIYAALFCLEYGMSPKKLSYDLQIYQAEEVIHYSPDPAEIYELTNKIIRSNNKILEFKNQEE